MNEVFQNRACKPPVKSFLLLAICDCADDQGRAFPSLNYLAWKTGLSHSTVTKFLKEFRTAGVIEDAGRRSAVERGISPHSDRDTGVLQLHIEKLPQKRAWRTNQVGSPRGGLGVVRARDHGSPCHEGGSPCDGSPIRKEPSLEPSIEPSVENHHACGALNAWLQIKQELKTDLSEADWNLFVRPMYLLKELSGGHLLLALPPVNRIVEAARSHRDFLEHRLAAHGLKMAGFTKYPEDMLDLPSGGEWDEVRKRIFNKRGERFVERELKNVAPWTEAV